ncbi:MAG: hypothetical protein H6810_03790 [Phycisphaeraceae bacterium]|nr:MAG: hypothetical protein H6810_03790 [Phycisphaeraceae bacterium]
MPEDRPLEPPAESPEDRKSRLGFGACHAQGKAPVLWSLATAGAMFAAVLLRKWFEWPRAALVVLALLPVLPLIGMCVAMARASSRLDELQRRIQLEALGLTVLVMSVVLVSLGMLESFGLIGHFDPTMAWVLMVAIYVISFWWIGRKYRS